LKCDIRKFFDRIDHAVLLKYLEKMFDPVIFNIIKNVIASFHTEIGKGLPLGNVTSQLFANVYLHELDWFIKHTLRMRHYVRYCDDFILLAASPEIAWVLADKIDTFLTNTLKLQLHPDKVLVRTWKQGIDFLGYVLLPHATILRPKTADRMLRQVTQENVSSYLGLCAHANAHELVCTVQNMIASPPSLC
jgi:hypothetical protein